MGPRWLTHAGTSPCQGDVTLAERPTTSGRGDDAVPAAVSDRGGPLAGSVAAESAEGEGQALPVGTVVFDTSALVADPEGVFAAYPGADLVIPLTVVEELDGLKKRLDAVGAAARELLRAVETFRHEAGGDLRQPCPRPGGGTIRVELNGIQTGLLREHGLDATKADNRIIGAALGQHVPGQAPVTIVSNDTAVRVKAATFGLQALEHDPLDVASRGPSGQGWHELEVDGTVVNALYEGDGRPEGAEDVLDALKVNEYGVLRAGSSQSVLVRRRPDRLSLVPQELPAWDMRPRNKEQRFALDLLLDPDVKVVALDGAAGTGKTLLAVAAGLQQVVEEGKYARLCVYRPVIPVGKAELGYLPGTLDEKLDPWMAAITDAVYALTDDHDRNDADRVLDEIRERGQMTMESVTHLRGRTLHDSFVLVDEAMNLSPQVGKTILTRIAEDSKVVFTGDTSQIDAAFLSAQTNALTALIAAFSGQSLFGHVQLQRGERSELAELAARLM
jgi:PhoH-like ATPase